MKSAQNKISEEKKKKGKTQISNKFQPKFKGFNIFSNR